jgi:purine-binding chemotaxis protein CheW
VTGALHFVLVVGAGRPELGLCAASVEEVAPLTRAALLPAPPSLAPEGRELVSGIDREGLILLEGDALLGDSRLVFNLDGERDA